MAKKRSEPFRTGAGPHNRPDRCVLLKNDHPLHLIAKLTFNASVRPWRTNVDAATASAKILDMGWVPQTSLPVR